MIYVIDLYEGCDLVGIASDEKEAKRIAQAYAYGECDGEAWIEFTDREGNRLDITY